MKTLRHSLVTGLVLLVALAQAGTTTTFEGPTIRSPRDGATVNGRNVVISGDSDSDTVKVSGFLGVDAAFRQQVMVRNGHWSMSRPMTAGNYQIKVEDKYGSTVIDLRVTGRGAGGGTVPGESVSFTSPRDGATVRGSNVNFSGRAEGDTVRLTVYEGSRRVYSGQPRVRNGRWSARVKLDDGSYRARIEQGRRKDEVRFYVGDGGGPDGEGSSGGHYSVGISSPSDGASVRGPRISVSGTSNAPSVGVAIYRGSRRVFNSSTKVSRGRWMFNVTLENGSYRVEVNSGSTKVTSDFTVRR